MTSNWISVCPDCRGTPTLNAREIAFVATSGTYSFAPSSGDFVLNAFGRIGIRRTELTQQHLADAANEANLVQVEFANRQPNLFLAETYDVSLVAGTATYVLPARFVSPMAVWMTIGSGASATDRILSPISTYDYESLPNKTQQAQPTTYWYQRQIIPQVTMWPVPETTYTLHLRILSQPQDVRLSAGLTPQMPYRWYDAFTAALAWRLAVIYAPDREAGRKVDAERAWQIAATEDIEYVPLRIGPAVGGYYR